MTMEFELCNEHSHPPRVRPTYISQFRDMIGEVPHVGEIIQDLRSSQPMRVTAVYDRWNAGEIVHEAVAEPA